MFSKDLFGVCSFWMGTLGKESDFGWGLSYFSEMNNVISAF